MGYNPEAEDGGPAGRPMGGLQGASAATQAAFDIFKKTGSDAPEVQALKADIKAGNTWEKLNTEQEAAGRAAEL